MEADIEREGLRHLAAIEQELEEIKERTPSPRQAFWNGILQGGGAIIGGIVAVLILGLVLSYLGVIPGLGHIAPYLQNAFDKFQR
ncbi:MAG TPA: hypothetical protein VF439_01140 [Candidatus Paceibacterota bacterium]